MRKEVRVEILLSDIFLFIKIKKKTIYNLGGEIAIEKNNFNPHYCEF